MVFKRWDVVKIPVPAAAGSVPEYRPALVIVAGDILRQHGLLWGLMITSASNSGWPGDVAISDTIAAGLGVPSVVRTAKVMTMGSRSGGAYRHAAGRAAPGGGRAGIRQYGPGGRRGAGLTPALGVILSRVDDDPSSTVIASAAKQSIFFSFVAEMDCFAALAMTAESHGFRKRV